MLYLSLCYRAAAQPEVMGFEVVGVPASRA